jgi:hypothetical protein
MAKTKLKTVERKTTVSRNAVSGAFAATRGANKDEGKVSKSGLKERTGTKKKSR